MKTAIWPLEFVKSMPIERGAELGQLDELGFEDDAVERHVDCRDHRLHVGDVIGRAAQPDRVEPPVDRHSGVDGLAERRVVAPRRLGARPGIVGVAGQAVRTERRLVRDEQVVRLDAGTLAQEADDLADVRIFELHELEGVAGRIAHRRRNVGGDGAGLVALDGDRRRAGRDRHVDGVVAAGRCRNARRRGDRKAHDQDGFDLLEADLPNQALEALRA